MNCRSCGAQIIWAVTQKNRNIPLDPVPVADGNITLEQRGAELAPLAIANAIRAPGILYYKSHFATCPNAANHRRSKKTRRLAAAAQSGPEGR